MKQIRVSDEAHQKLKIEAAARGRTISAVLDELIDQRGWKPEPDQGSVEAPAASVPKARQLTGSVSYDRRGVRAE